MSGEIPISKLEPNLGENLEQFWLEDRERTGKLCRPGVEFVWMCLKRDYKDRIEEVRWSGVD